MASPTSRTLQRLRAGGWTVAVAEAWIAQAGVKRDLFGAFDVVAIRPDSQGVLGVQATTGANHASRRAKLLANPAVLTWLQAGNTCEVWSWAQYKGRWEVRREALTLASEGLTTEPLTQKQRPCRQRKGERQRGLFD